MTKPEDCSDLDDPKYFREIEGEPPQYFKGVRRLSAIILGSLALTVFLGYLALR